VPSDVTRYCDKTFKLGNTENFKVLSMTLLQNSCWSLMEPDANSKILYTHIFLGFCFLVPSSLTYVELIQAL
jgi:hypothetical protein